jgi:hypothetical protein
MWTSDRSKKRAAEEAAADLGVVTLAEEQAGVYLDGERRWNQVYSPGGYSWRPALGEQVLVLKAGGEGEVSCVVGRKQPEGLKPGEVVMESGTGKAALRLLGGEAALEGNVTVNGVPLKTLIENISRSVLVE